MWVCCQVLIAGGAASQVGWGSRRRRWVCVLVPLGRERGVGKELATLFDRQAGMQAAQPRETQLR